MYQILLREEVICVDTTTLPQPEQCHLPANIVMWEGRNNLYPIVFLIKMYWSTINSLTIP